MMTSEVLYTDRVYYGLLPEYRLRLFGGESPRGDRYPSFAITWPAAKADFARAVISATESSVRLRAYSFETEPRTVPVRLWRLKPDRYKWSSNGRGGTFTVSSVPHTLELPLEPQKEISIVIDAEHR
jgi:hypothetical protein